MKVKALFADFYGTIVHEDGELIKKITQIICDTGEEKDASEVGSFWRMDFQKLLAGAFGSAFETQRALERKSLEHTLERFRAKADAEKLCGLLYDFWISPPLFKESKRFFEENPVPVYIVSNIDTADIKKAIRYHDLAPAGIYTSEEAKAYKPRRELFEMALADAGLRPDEVIHIGDSVTSDVKGASAAGIRPIWLNRSGRNIPEGVDCISDLLQVFDRIK